MQLLQGKQRQYFCVISVALVLLLSSRVGANDGTTKKTIADEGLLASKVEELRVKKVLDDSKYSIQPTVAEVPQQQQKSKEAAAAADEKIMNKQKMDDVAEQPPSHPLEAKNKTGIIKPQSANNDKKNLAITTTSSSSSSSSSLQHMYEGEEDISDSLKAGFYFFVALSLSAISFIIFKVYRLRLSRAERKYGVQGDRSTQELTPLPIGIEDCHSDEEDQTLFDVQRQNIRIL